MERNVGCAVCDGVGERHYKSFGARRVLVKAYRVSYIHGRAKAAVHAREGCGIWLARRAPRGAQVEDEILVGVLDAIWHCVIGFGKSCDVVDVGYIQVPLRVRKDGFQQVRAVVRAAFGAWRSRCGVGARVALRGAGRGVRVGSAGGTSYGISSGGV